MASKSVEQPKTVTLNEDDVAIVTSLLNDLNLTAVAMHRLAHDGIDSGQEEWYMHAIEQMAMVSARKIDMVDALISGHSSFGNFVEEFDLMEMRKGHQERRESEAAGTGQ